ncbi:MAG TPA: spherulation-specific family 4 protein, partial [Nitrososphaera sp.]|nr:spherulation-specific family 4 protein [Nitrososphaera sp.]
MQTAQARPYLKIIVIVASVLLAVAAAASLLLSNAKVTFAKSEETYVIYYGHLVDESGAMTPQARSMLDAGPSLVIVPYSFPTGEPNITPELRQAFHDRGIKVIAYTWTNYSARPLNEVTAEIDSYLSQSDGIFVDEVTNIETDAEFSYYSAIYQHVKENHDGNDKMVIMNPGHYKVSEEIM